MDKNLIYSWMAVRHPGLCLVIRHLQELGADFPVTLSFAAEAELVVATISTYSCRGQERVFSKDKYFKISAILKFIVTLYNKYLNWYWSTSMIESDINQNEGRRFRSDDRTKTSGKEEKITQYGPHCHSYTTEVHENHI